MKTQIVIDSIRRAIKLSKSYPHHANKTLGTLADNLQKQADTDDSLPWRIVAYIPQGEDKPVLLVCLGDLGISRVFRRKDAGYLVLLDKCLGKPEWIYGCKPVALE